MKVNLTIYPHGTQNKDRSITLCYDQDIHPQLPFFSKDGTYDAPRIGQVISKIPLKHGFSFKGQVFEDPVVDKENQTVSISLSEILVSRDSVLHPELTPGSMAEILSSNKLE